MIISEMILYLFRILSYILYIIFEFKKIMIEQNKICM